MPRILPVRIGIRDCFILVLLVIFNTIHITDMANNNMDTPSKLKKSLKDSNEKLVSHGSNSDGDEYLKSCHVDQNSIECSALQYPCISCNRSIDCRYGGFYNYTCMVKSKILCNGSKTFNRTGMCRFCYQTEKWEHRCDQKANCNSLASPLRYYPICLACQSPPFTELVGAAAAADECQAQTMNSTNCTVSDEVICLGKRRFLKNIRCSWTAGTRWGTALILALTLGGFGADRFYLGHWQEGIGKLFSFGGLGVWTLVDALLIGIHHLGPADGSLFL